MAKLIFYIGVFLFLVVVVGCGVLFLLPTYEEASYFSTTFGLGASLFSGAALGLALYSFILQKDQNDKFQEVTLKTLEGQMQALELLKKSIDEQAEESKVAALSSLIISDKNLIEDLENWNKSSSSCKYNPGIESAKKRISKNRNRIKEINDKI
jgi:hypothetical protein